MAGTYVEIADLLGPQGPAGALSRGAIPTGSNINTWNTSVREGAWVVNSTTAAGTITGLPEAAAGQLLNLPGIGSQIYTAYGPEPKIWFRGVNNVTSGAWGAWQDLSSRATMKSPALIPAGTNLNFWYTPATAGTYAVNSTTAAEGITNLPVVAAGVLLNMNPGTAFQIYLTYGAEPGYWFRGVINLATKAWSPWVNLAAKKADTSPALEHAVRADAARKRVGYKVGTAGKGVIMLRFDDYPADFAAKCLPVLRSNDLPAYFASTVRWVEELQPTPWATVEGWAVNDGVQIWNHSWSHSAASTTAELVHEIVESADYMETQMPKVKIDGWVMPGTGVTEGPYGGYNGKTDADFYNTEAGRLILGRHGIVNAARAGYFQPAGHQHYIGQTHTTYETWTVQQFKDAVTAASLGGYGLALMTHPGNMDGAGYMTTAQFTECMVWLAAERAAGRVMVLTGSAAVAIDKDASTRDNLLPGTFGTTLNGWAGTGWTVAGGNAVSPATTDPLTFTVDTLPRAWARGGSREFHAIAKAATATTIRLTATGTGLNATKDYVIPTGSFVDIRKFFTIPHTGLGTLTFSISRVSGGTFELAQANAWAA